MTSGKPAVDGISTADSTFDASHPPSLFARPKHGVRPDHTASNHPPSWLPSVAPFTEAPLSLSRHRRRSHESSSLSVLYRSHPVRIVVAVSFLQGKRLCCPHSVCCRVGEVLVPGFVVETLVRECVSVWLVSCPRGSGVAGGAGRRGSRGDWRR